MANDTVKIKIKNHPGDRRTEFGYTNKDGRTYGTVITEEDGTAEVPVHVAEQLEGHPHFGHNISRVDTRSMADKLRGKDAPASQE